MMLSTATLSTTMDAMTNHATGWAALTLGDQSFWHRIWMRAEPGTENAQDTDDMYMWLWWFCVAWFIFLMALMVYFVAKYRRKPGQIAPRSAAHNTPLEIAWTIIPTLFLVFIFFKGFWGYIDKMVAPGEALEVRITGAKWSWTLQYPNGAESSSVTEQPLGFKPVPVFYMPAEVPVRLRMNSADVMHAFWVPDFRIKQDVLPNRYTTQWFKAKAPKGDKVHKFEDGGKTTVEKTLHDVPYEDHWVFCAEYCGDEHSEMAAIIRVIPENVWNTWVGFMRDNPDDAPEIIGARMFKTKCSSCHTVDGGTNTGPTWKNLFGNTSEFTDGTSIVVDENHIRESIKYPSRKIRKTFKNEMTPFEGLLNEKQIDGVIAYMKTLSDKGGVAPATPPGETKPEETPATPQEPAAPKQN